MARRLLGGTFQKPRKRSSRSTSKNKRKRASRSPKSLLRGLLSSRFSEELTPASKRAEPSRPASVFRLFSATFEELGRISPRSAPETQAQAGEGAISVTAPPAEPIIAPVLGESAAEAQVPPLAQEISELKPEAPAIVHLDAVIQPPRPESPGPSFEEEPKARKILSTELIRPDERLKHSIEGFLLDQRSEHTKRAYGKDLKRFVQFLLTRREAFGAERIDRMMIIAYKDFLLAEGLEHTTVDRHLATLRSFFAWMVDDGILEKNPAEGVRFLNPRRLSRTSGFTDEEVTKLLKLPNLHLRTGAQHYAILMILFHCGLRRSEVCSLRTSHLGLERGHYVLRLRGKGNAERVVVLVPAVWNALRHYFRITAKSMTQDAPLFSPIRNNRTGVKEKPLDPSMIFYIVTKYAKAAGVVNRVSPHSCRATAISNARDHNVPDRAIQEFAGWASPDMITRYDKRKSAVEKSAAHAIQYGSEDRAIPEGAPFSTAQPPSESGASATFEEGLKNRD